ncbi:unnamed protein product [Rotaria sp. Silwood2]|nr:unnamed protein product [Rotaria sp. Silwood2]
MKYSLTKGKIYLVSNYGAYPNDDLDDTNGIQLAINEAINDEFVSNIVFGYDIYSISSTILIFNAANLTRRGEGINQTFLIGYNQVSIFFAQYCQGLKLTSFSIDYNSLPFTAGYIVNVDDKYVHIQVVPLHQADINRQVQAILRYDPIQNEISFCILRLPLRSSTQFLKGDPVVARYVIYGQDITDITIQSITIYTSWGMGFVTLRAKRLNINNYYVLPQNGRWMSIIVDCMHFTDTREYVSISDSKCQAMGDDATNWTDPLDVGVGTSLEFSNNQQPFTVHDNGTIALLIFNSTNSRKIIFTNPVSVNVGDWACVANTPTLTIRNFTVAHNRARGVLLETRNIDIRQSLFYRTSGPAVLIQPSMYWHEGKGIITILPDSPQLVPVINDIRIESSTFYFGIHSQELLQCDNTNKLFISGNYIATNNSIPLISICNSRNISAENNCVVNNQTKIDEYYTFDETNLRLKNLSSLIDLPPSAFNSSFPLPVIRKDVFLYNHQYQLNKRNYFQ